MKKYAVVNTRRCVACGACLGSCPRGAISIYKGCYAKVDEEKCAGCGLCGSICPANVIEVKDEN